MSMSSTNSKFRTALLCGAAAVVAGPAWGQDAGAGPDVTTVEELVISGSRIVRNEFDSAAPLVTFGEDEIAESGVAEISELIAELPAAASSYSENTVTGNVQNSGLSSVQLRNLGDNRTLVLIDGRRTVSNSANGNRVSLSTIPSGFIRRVEVLTGGTSSIYGSDAVAGVVNIITENRHTGLEFGVRAGVTDEGGGEETNYEITWGDRFSDGRGYILVSGSYEKDWGILATDREWATRQVDYAYDNGVNMFDTLYINEDGELTSDYQPAGTFPPNTYHDLSSNILGGAFRGSSSSRRRFYIGDQLVPLGPNTVTGEPVEIRESDPGNTGYFLQNRDGYNQREGRSLSIPRERYLFAAKVDYDLGGDTEAFGQIQYSRVETLEHREPEGASETTTFQVIDPDTGESSEVTIGRIPCRRATGSSAGHCNPFVPDEIRADVSTDGSGLRWQRRFAEVGDRSYQNTRETIRSWAGLRGKVWSDWDWEASLGYGRFEQNQVRRGNLNGYNLMQGLDAIEVGGEIVCRDQSNGCVPVNLFGEGAITPEAADYIRVELEQNAVITQTNFLAYATGDLWQLPAGPLAAAFGVEYRRDEQQLRGDPLSQYGGSTGNIVPNFEGSIEVYETFAEFSAPLVRDRPGIRSLSIDGSLRLAHYDIENVSGVVSYRGGVQWAPVDDVRFRFQYARAQRAPDLAELYSPARGDFDSVPDICRGVTPASTGQVAQNCLADPGIQALFLQQAADGEDQVFNPGGGSIYSPNAGNLELREETADTMTFGVVLRPRFLSGLTAAIDYYDISIDDVISEYSNEDLLIQCYDSALSADANPFCGYITRNPNTGNISQILQRQFNLSSLTTRGIDVAVQYRFDLERIGVPGRWDFRYDATHVLEHSLTFEGAEETTVSDRKGDLSAGIFEYRSRASIRWTLDNLRLRWTTRYHGEIVDSRTRLAAYEELLLTNPAAERPMFLWIDGVFRHDIYAGYDFEVGGHEFRLYGGVHNVFNEISPFLPTGDVVSGRLSNYNSAYDVAGRRFYIGLTANF